MAEPEDLIADGARRALVSARKLWQRKAAEAGREKEDLATHRRRLELLIAAVYGREMPVRAAQPPAPPSFLRRLFGKPQRFVSRIALPATDGGNVFLPREPTAIDGLPPSRLYRIWALSQAGRAVRGVAAIRLSDELANELFVISEAMAVEVSLARELPGLAADLRRLREEMEKSRPSLDGLEALERELELRYREALGDPAGGAVPVFSSPQETRAWAGAEAATLSARHGGRFRGFLHDAFLGAVWRREGRATEKEEQAGGEEARKQQVVRLPRRPRIREAEEDEDDREPGAWMMQMDDPHEHVEDPMGMQRPTDRETGENPGDTADSLSELEEARVVRTPDRPKEVFESDDPPPAHGGKAKEGASEGIVYPEWDHRLGDYRPRGATVWIGPRSPGDPAWAARVMEERRALLGEVRRRFEGLKPRRETVGRQVDGEELDIDACVQAHAERIAGVSNDDRLYRTTLPRRRDLATLLLIDASGSTDAWVTEELRIIDVEKEALLFCCHALDALGDPYAIQAFSGQGPHGVRVWGVKEFEERDRHLVHRRIAGLEPEEYTRAGAAIRHATATLASRSESKRLLLLISDGKPNDADQYGGVHGIEDTRQAVAEAAMVGIHVFCLTVDRDAPSYMHRIFGPSRFATLAHARELPFALVEALRELIR